MIFDEAKYREYANCFWDEINSAFYPKRSILGYLPIIFVEHPNVSGMKYINGATAIHSNEKKRVYSCFPIVFIRSDNTESQLYQTIRHEVIHYFLALHYYKHEDNSALFALMCSLFDGGAYEQLSDKAQLIFETAKPYLEQAYELYIRNKEIDSQSIRLPMQLSIMLMEIDDAEHDQASDIKSLEASLALTLKVCKTISPNK